jgi:hypothetical protein
MTKAEEQALKAYPRTDDAWGDEWQKRVGFVEGYNQAEKDLMEKFKMWVIYNGYTAKDAEAVYNDFKQFITEN